MAVFSVPQALEMAVKIEEHGEAFYRAAAARSSDQDVQELFQELADQERSHRDVFEGMVGEQVTSKTASSDVGDYASFLAVALDHAVFEGPEKALRMAEQADDRSSVLRAAMGFEKDTLLFYYDLREMVAERDRDTISDIIRQEKQHLRQLAGQV